MGQDADEVRGRHVVVGLRPGDTVRQSSSGQMDYEGASGGSSIAGPAGQERSIPDIKADIRLARGEMSRTIDQLQRRLEPERLKRQVGQAVKTNTLGRAQDMFENTRMAGGGIVDRVRQNPIPAAMVAIGLGWLFSRAGEGRSDMVGAAQDRLAGVAGQAQAQASQMRETARVQASQARSGFDQLLTDSPLAVGAVALAAGVAIGMAAPSTPKEHELMGQARDRLLDQAQSRAEEAVDKAQQVAHKAVSSAREEARNQGLTS